jgi:hypothetical protein
MDEMEFDTLRRYAAYIQSGLTLSEAQKLGFVQDANDAAHWNLAAKDPASYTADAPDSEIVDPSINDMSIIDDLLTRIKGMTND